VAIGMQIVDLAAAVERGVFQCAAARPAMAAAGDALNALMALGPQPRGWRCGWRFRAPCEGAPAQRLLEPCLVAQTDAEYTLPARIGDNTDLHVSASHLLTSPALSLICVAALLPRA
jgi:fumarylacetoacetase